MSEAAPPEKPTVSHLSYSEMIGVYHLLIGRVETSWFRIMYLHAAMIGALVFFYEADQVFLLPRTIVFAFYTANLVIFHVALREGYTGLRQVHEDLAQFPPSGGNLDAWMRTRSYVYRTPVRVAIMLTAWAVIAVLLFSNVLNGPA